MRTCNVKSIPDFSTALIMMEILSSIPRELIVKILMKKLLRKLMKVGLHRGKKNYSKLKTEQIAQCKLYIENPKSSQLTLITANNFFVISIGL